ncbi:hypothetical protein PTKU64_58560 [Paraburkholderia terrae]|uniref:Uncharacterized protein n=1 Tax=Paraburkholderia terrae TaxID=311230 RepID=A0ABM7TST8_9BURK|nr:hypothetical protein PTKU64_58560 [Paraburkholderia terrae]
MFVANALALRLTRFTHPRYGTPFQIFHRRPGGKLCVGRCASHASLRTDSTRIPPCKSGRLYDATTYTQFATWAAHAIRCRLPEYGYLKRVRRTFKALATHANRKAAV